VPARRAAGFDQRHAVLDGEVHLERAGPAAEMPVGACNSWWRPIAENTGDGLRREVEHCHIGGWQLAGRVGAHPRFDLAAQVGQQRCDRVGDRLRTAGRDRPPVTMPRGEDAQPDRRGHRIVQRLASGDAMASYALSEREAGSDPASMRTRARADGDDWVLNGSKCWITNGGKSTWYTVMAVTDPDKGANGISAFVVHKDDEGFTVGPKERKLGIKGSPTTELYFENCRIPGDRIIGEPGSGFKTALASLDHTRPTIGAQAVGIAQGALDAAIAYTKERKQFRRPVSDFQGVQFMLADMAMKVEAARLMVYTAAARAERGEPGLSFISAATKCFASDVAMEVTTTNAVQLFGGAGYTIDFPVERMMRDAKITQIYEGTNQIQRVVMARALLA
jgi:alkylation response protein AidB-like acyl-CoA dehydrogenase